LSGWSGSCLPVRCQSIKRYSGTCDSVTMRNVSVRRDAGKHWCWSWCWSLVPVPVLVLCAPRQCWCRCRCDGAGAGAGAAALLLLLVMLLVVLLLWLWLVLVVPRRVAPAVSSLTFRCVAHSLPCGLLTSRRLAMPYVMPSVMPCVMQCRLMLCGICLRLGVPMSATADATHFNECSGDIVLDSCWLEGQGDEYVVLRAARGELQS
jgi:hypothetical protein